MSMSKWYRYGATPLLLAGLGAPALLSGCGDDPLGGCDFVLEARVKAFQGAVAALVKVSGEVTASIGVACANMAEDIDGTRPAIADETAPTDDEVSAACDAASAAISGSITASGSITIQVVGGKCEVNASAQFSCEADCSVDASCDPGSVEVRCSPGELSGECSAECSGSCTVETGSIECEGGCSGECSGTCSGSCSAMDGAGNCAGKCEGSCTGSCTGTCEVVAPSASCSGSCKGGCSVEVTAPSCEAKLEPPSCDLDADCSAGCEGEASLSAECTPPSIKIEGNVELVATLEANLPAIFLLFEVQGALIVDAAVDIAGKAVGVAEGVINDAGCALTFGASLAGEFSAAAEASVSVSVSVDASASASGSTGG